jgi:ribosome modulation factor
LESFLTKSGVKISHGVCPDCAVKVREQWAQQWKQMQAEKNDHP